MARTKRSAKLDSPSSRLKLKAGVRHQFQLEEGQYLAYRRPTKGEICGTWSARYYDSKTGDSPLEKIGKADDYKSADGVNFLSYKQALEKADEWFEGLNKTATGQIVKAGPFTVADAIDAYLEHMGEGRTTVHRMRVTAERSILPVLGAVEVSQLTRYQIMTWRNGISTSPRGRRHKEKPVTKPRNFRKPRKPSKAQAKAKEAPKPPSTKEEKRARQATANRIMTLLKASLNHAKTSGLVRCPDDAWRSAKKFKGVIASRGGYMLEEEQQRLVNSIKAADFRDLASGALATGARYSELAALVVGDFDPKSRTVFINKGKTEEDRRVPLLPWGVEFFKAITAGRAKKETMFRREHAERRKLKEGEDPLAWRTSDQFRPMNAACEAAGLEPMGFNQIRHSYASALVSAGMPLFLVAKLMGHANTKMLEKHYAHLAPSDLSKALEVYGHTLDLGAPRVETLHIKKGV